MDDVMDGTSARNMNHNTIPGDGGATLGTCDAVDVACVAWGATKNSGCDGVGQRSDPLEGHVI